MKYKKPDLKINTNFPVVSRIEIIEADSPVDLSTHTPNRGNSIFSITSLPLLPVFVSIENERTVGSRTNQGIRHLSWSEKVKESKIINKALTF